MKKELSVIIVNYEVKKELLNCIKSIIDSKPKYSYEIIIVDNSEKSVIEKELKKKFPKVNYIKSSRNLGYGGGVNLGVVHAKGGYIFILNPDTVVFPNTINILVSFLKKNKKVGVAAPNLYDKNENIFPKQGFSMLTPLRAIFSLSLLNKIFPNNSVSRSYWRDSEDKNKMRFVDIVPGTAFVISKNLFEKVGGFDEKFFLFFEEFDLCKKVRKAGYLIVMLPKTKVIHFWGESTRKNSDTDKIFLSSRYYYFKKNFGLLKALLVEMILRTGKNNLLLFLILIIAAFLRFYRLSETIPFYGDVGWFYLSARDMLLTHNIPLVGIASSHVWIHQGAFWTYILSVMLKIFNFNPFIPAYFVAFFGVITLFFVYEITKRMFSIKLALIASFLYATSPAVIQDSRIPYHTSLIPFFALFLLFFVFKWVNGNIKYFPLIIMFLGILYNFEIATFSLSITVLLVLFYGLLRRKKWALSLINKKILSFSLLGLTVPLVPMILYDIHHGFPQTVKFIVWIIYKIAVIFGFPKLHPNAPGETWATFFPYLFRSIRGFVFEENQSLALLILCLSIFFLFGKVLFDLRRKQKITPHIIVLLFFSIPAFSYLSAKTNSAAYFLMFYPQMIIMIAIFFSFFMKNKYLAIISSALILIVGFSNSYLLIKNIGCASDCITQRMDASKKIIEESNGRPYNIVGIGQGSQYESFVTPYKYLTWYLGKPSSVKNEKLKFYISEYPDRIKIEVRK